MTRLERALYRRRTMLFVIAGLLFLGAAVAVAFVLIGHQTDRSTQLATDLSKARAEADLRGTAVSTLAGDVRALRAQVQAEGKTPVAPDPSKAVPSLPDRTAVPVPIPGPPGPKGDKGDPGASGSPAPIITPSPGASGAQGIPGASGADGKDGQDGAPGAPGQDGAQGPQGETGPTGPPGPNCPTGYSLQTSPSDPYAVVCRQDGAPSPTPSPSPSSSPPVVLSDRRRI